MKEQSLELKLTRSSAVNRLAPALWLRFDCQAV
jgi:hypothetical protein